MTNLQEAARRMYSAKGFTDYGKIFGAGLKEAAKNIAIFSRQEEQEAEQKRKEREGKLERLYGAGPRINEGTVPPEMRGEVVTYLRDQRNMYDQLANQLVDYSASDPEYRDITNQMDNIKDNYANMANQINLFTKRANDYTSKKDNWSGVNNETDRNIVSEVYNRDFKNFAIVDNQLVVETEQGGVKTMDDIHNLYENLVPRAAKQMTDGLSLIRNANTSGLRGASFSPDQIRLQLGTILSNEDKTIQKQNKQSLALDRNFGDELGMSFKKWVFNNNKLDKDTMDLDGNDELDNGWIKNDENEGALTGLLVDYYVDLAEKSHQSGKKIYDRDNPEPVDDTVKIGELVSEDIEKILEDSKAFTTETVGDAISGLTKKTGIDRVETTKNLALKLSKSPMYNNTNTSYGKTMMLPRDVALEKYIQNYAENPIMKKKYPDGLETSNQAAIEAITKEATDEFNNEFGNNTQLFEEFSNGNIVSVDVDILNKEKLVEFLIARKYLTLAKSQFLMDVKSGMSTGIDNNKI
mgnify:CR=1 FL=1|tara:strand:- start:1555 stop:3123 length:1569 start_codon:yes stop_codon:yes gene_type:complete